MGDYKTVKIEAGRGGWGGPLEVTPTDDKPLIYSVTGGGIHPVAAKIAELTGGEAFDGFKSSAKFEKIACAVIDCGGTARVGVYPMKKVPTVDIYPTSPAGPLSMFIKEDVFVSGVGPDQIKPIE
ncbi:MAG: PTS sorbitol transporter [Actinobacteria bacterium]|nr:PTS sorbitol transporter [Actinomycetota bacterium]